MPCGEVELTPTASSMLGKWIICLTLMADGAFIMGSVAAVLDGDCEGTASDASAGPVWRRMGACVGNAVDAGRCVTWACESRLAAVGVFSSGNMAAFFTPLERLSELRFEAFPELGASDSSSSSSSDRSSRPAASARSLARRAALTEC